MAAVIDENVGAVAGIIGRTETGDEVELELLLLPLSHAGHARVRALGVLAPLTPPYWLGERPVVELELKTLRHIDGRQTDKLARHVSGNRARVNACATASRSIPAAADSRVDAPANASLTIG